MRGPCRLSLREGWCVDPLDVWVVRRAWKCMEVVIGLVRVIYVTNLWIHLTDAFHLHPIRPKHNTALAAASVCMAIGARISKWMDAIKRNVFRTRL